VHSKKRKKIELVVLENEKVKILSPLEKSSDQIHQLVKSTSRWIFQQQLRLREHKDKNLQHIVMVQHFHISEGSIHSESLRHRITHLNHFRLTGTNLLSKQNMRSLK